MRFILLLLFFWTTTASSNYLYCDSTQYNYETKAKIYIQYNKRYSFFFNRPWHHIEGTTQFCRAYPLKSTSHEIHLRWENPMTNIKQCTTILRIENNLHHIKSADGDWDTVDFICTTSDTRFGEYVTSNNPKQNIIHIALKPHSNLICLKTPKMQELAKSYEDMWIARRFGVFSVIALICFFLFCGNIFWILLGIAHPYMVLFVVLYAIVWVFFKFFI